MSKLAVPISVSIAGLAKTQAQFAQLGKGISNLGKGAGLAAVGFAAFTTAMKASDFAVNAIAGARDLERNMAGLKTVFEDITPEMQKFSREAVTMGLSINEAAKSSTFIGSVLKQSGFDINETANLTQRLVGLAQDLSITYGYDVQEALLGMTALFRGEYDPIEKFGVAMKQSEINAELAAQKLSHLEGAERRFAEQQIRVNFLFERSSDALGAYGRQAGTLAVEQQNLAAQFANIKDTVATSLLPVIADMMIQLQGVMEAVGPELKQTFDDLAPVIADAAQVLIPAMVDGFMILLDIIGETIALIGDAFNPLTDLGESFTALGIEVASLWETITGSELTVSAVFDAITWVVNLLVDALHDVIYVVENTVIGFKVLGEMATAFFTGDWNKLVTTDWTQQITSQIALKDAFNANELAVAKFNSEIANTKAVLDKANKAWANSWIARGEAWAKANPQTVIEDAVTGGSETGGASTKVKDYIADFYANIKDEIAKQSARIKLEGLGASESLIEQIIGGEGWQKVFNDVIADGKRGIKELQDQFNKTSAGIKELEALREEASRAAEEAAKIAQEEAQKLLDAYEELLTVIEDFKSGLEEVSKIDVLPTIEAEVGRFENAIIGAFENIRSNLEQGFVDGAILAEDFNKIQAWAAAEEAALQTIAQQRDDLANRYSLSEALIAEYRGAITSALSLTNLFSQIEAKTKEVTTTNVIQGATNIGASLKDLKFTLTTSYTETITETINKTEELVKNFKSVAEKARSFADNLRKLRDMGLDPQLFNQLVQAGVEAGGETAQALVDGGSETVGEINSIFAEIDKLGADLGEEVATTLYGSGVNLADGLLEGIRSRQTELETLARTMAETFKQTFDNAVGVATGRAAATAQLPIVSADLEAAQAEVDRINARIAENTAVLTGGTAGPNARAWAESKLDSYQDQLLTATEALRSASGAVADANTAIGASLDLPSSAMQPDSFSASSTGNVVNNYTVNVTADTRLSGSKAGEAVVQQLVAYQNQNGSVTAVLQG